ncbi:MAG TPA: ferritin-like domain-containing protein [Ohtaekwangia sp.]|nr:ferritin-like domain-containing protein [Ohtaekwangia sp.]
MPRSTTKKSGNSTGVSQLEEYFLQELKDIFGAEKQLTKALPKLQKAATTEELKEALEEHLAVTQEHIARIEEVFELMEKKPNSKKCEAMEGITKEGETVVKETEAGSMTRDAAIIMAAQKVEHYEIATYGGLVQLAKTIGRDDVADILAQTLEEEKETDQLLTEIAEAHINAEAHEEEAE